MLTEGHTELWNNWHQPPPEPFTSPTAINQNVKQKVLLLREKLFIIEKSLNGLECLHVEAATLSRFLYRNYRAFRKDKGFQLMKMVMSCLNKYLKMGLKKNVDVMRRSLPIRFPPLIDEDNLPTRATLGWILSRIQAFSALFYRIVHLTKRAGMFLYLRLRLNWNPSVLVLCLGMAARIHAISRYLVLESVNWHSSISPLVRGFIKTAYNPYQEYPRDLKAWLGGLTDLIVQAKTSTNPIDLVLQLIDLTEEDQEDEDHRGFVQVIKDFGPPAEKINDDEVKRLYEVVALDNTSIENEEPDDECLLDSIGSIGNINNSEDIGELVSLKSVENLKSEDIGEPVSLKSVQIISDGDESVVEISPVDNLTKGQKRRRRLRNSAGGIRKKLKQEENMSTGGSLNTSKDKGELVSLKKEKLTRGQRRRQAKLADRSKEGSNKGKQMSKVENKNKSKDIGGRDSSNSDKLTRGQKRRKRPASVAGQIQEKSKKEKKTPKGSPNLRLNQNEGVLSKKQQNKKITANLKLNSGNDLLSKKKKQRERRNKRRYYSSSNVKQEPC